MSISTRPPSVILRDMARLVEARAIIYRGSYINERLRALIDECQNSVLLRDKELREFMAQAIRDVAIPRNPNDSLGAVERDRCEKVGRGEG